MFIELMVIAVLVFGYFGVAIEKLRSLGWPDVESQWMIGGLVVLAIAGVARIIVLAMKTSKWGVPITFYAFLVVLLLAIPWLVQ